MLLSVGKNSDSSIGSGSDKPWLGRVPDGVKHAQVVGRLQYLSGYH